MTLNELKSMSPEQLFRLYEVMRTDYEMFAKVCLGHIVTEVPWFHHEMYQAMNKRYEMNGFVLFRGAGKSSISKTIQVTADLCFAKEPFTCLISESVDQASKDLVSVVDELENNEIINVLFGSLKGRLWNQEEIEASNGCFVKCRGYGSRIRGLKWKSSRITKCILDDYESEANTGTDKQREQVKNWIDAQVLPAGIPNQSTFQFFGTIVHPEAHLATIKNLPSFSAPYGYYMEVPIEQGGKAAWESRFPMSYIKMKEQEAISKNKLGLWLQEMYHIPAIQGKPRFNTDMIKKTSARFYNESTVTYLVYEGRKIPVNVFIGVDPASSLSERADFSIFFVIAQLPNKDYVVLDIQKKKIRPYEQAELVLKLVQKYNPVFVTIETQGYQGALADTCRELMLRYNEPFTIREFKSNQNKANKWLLGLDPYINQGRISYIDNCEGYDDFVRELTAYNEEYREHDDTLDGAFLAITNSYPPSDFNVDEVIKKITSNNKKKHTPNNWVTI